MKFRTEIKTEKSGLRLSPEFPLVLVGSCFADNMSAMMQAHLWKAENPLGVLYNPFSIEKALNLVLLSENTEKEFEKTLFQVNGVWKSWLFYSRMSSCNKEELIETFLKKSAAIKELLEKGKVLIVTFGTSWCYWLSSRNQLTKQYSQDIGIVGNCHKQPSDFFERRRASIDEIVECWNNLLTHFKKRYKGLNVVFTVSPVRHLKDGFEGNARSKAILLLAVEEICKNNENCHYFPAYEILNDDLRDYRFYATDLVHPSEEGVEYIWEKFKETFLDEQGINLLKEGEKIMRAWRHRPLMPLASDSEESKEEEERRIKIESEYLNLKKRYPDLGPLL